MWKIVLIAVVQSAFLTMGHVSLKLATMAAGQFSWSREYWFGSFSNWRFIGWMTVCATTYGIAGLLWMYILKHVPFSIAHPLSSICYVLGLLAAMFVFHEHVSMVRWLGVLFIIAGCVMIMK
ncbi:MAG TPA: EamA family transporter [Candidatus Coprenecus pullistercoris]|nr:EamA family transporter [Candidatus Coprenecus pullistercoris]